MTALNFVRQHRMSISVLVLIVALFAILGVGLLHDPRELPTVLIGKPWPDRSLPQMGSNAPGGSPIGIEQLRGKPRLFNVWASWCFVCSQEQPTLLDLGERLRQEGRADQLIGINYKDYKPDALAWLQRYGNPFATNLVDKDGRMGMDLGVYGAPESFVIDSKGTIVWKFVGGLTPEVIEREVLPRLRAAS